MLECILLFYTPFSTLNWNTVINISRQMYDYETRCTQQLVYIFVSVNTQCSTRTWTSAMNPLNGLNQLLRMFALKLNTATKVTELQMAN